MLVLEVHFAYLQSCLRNKKLLLRETVNIELLLYNLDMLVYRLESSLHFVQTETHMIRVKYYEYSKKCGFVVELSLCATDMPEHPEQRVENGVE